MIKNVLSQTRSSPENFPLWEQTLIIFPDLTLYPICIYENIFKIGVLKISIELLLFLPYLFLLKKKQLKKYLKTLSYTKTWCLCTHFKHSAKVLPNRQCVPKKKGF